MSSSDKIQLQISGNTGVFDYLVSADSFIAATKNTISVHPLDYAGSPRQQLDYDTGVNPVAAYVQQHHNHSAFATIDKRQLAVWDISTSLLSESFTNPGIKDDEWSSFVWSAINPGEFLTGSKKGVLSLWDRRTDEHPLHTCIIPNKRISKFIWSIHHEHTVLIKAEADYLVSLDLRMLTNYSSDASNHENRKRVLSWTKTPFPIKDFVVRDTSPEVVLLYNNFSMQHLNFVDHKLSHTTTSYPSFDAYIQQDYHPHSLYIDEISNQAVMICRDNDRQQSRSVLFTLPGFEENTTDSTTDSPSKQLLPLAVEDTEKMNESVQSCFWKAGQQLMAVTPSGAVHFLHPKENGVIISPRPPRYSHSSLKSVLSVTLPGERLWADQSPRELINTPLVAANHHARMTMSISSLSSNNASSASTVRTVVGPLRFRLLLVDEIRVLEYALKTRALLEGLTLTSINEFTRAIVLDCSLQSTNSAYTRHLSSSSMQFQHQLLMSFNSINEVQQQPVITITLTFPKKLSNFWQGLALSLENRSPRMLDMDELKAEILADIQPIILELSKVKAASASLAASTTSTSTTAAGNSSLASLASLPGGPLTPSTGHRLFSHSTSRSFDFSTFLLFNVIKTIRDKIHSYCEKVQFQRQQSLTACKSQSLTRNSSSDDNELADLNTTASSHYSISKKHRTPFPCLSAGIFSATGRLCLFGNAVLIVDECKDIGRQNFSEAIDHIPTKLYLSPMTPNDPSNENKEDESKSHNSNHRHQSLAQLMRHQVIQSTVQKSNKEAVTNADYTSSKVSTGNDRSSSARVIQSEGGRVPSPIGGNKNIARAASNEDYAVAMVEVTSSDTLSISIPAAAPPSPHIIRPTSSPTLFTNFSAMTTMATVTAAATSTRAVDVSKPPTNVFALIPSLLPKQVALASKYVFLPSGATTTQRAQACQNNADIIRSLLPNRNDLHQFWVLLGVAMDVLDMGEDNPLCNDPLSWSSGALGRSMVMQLFQEVDKLGILTTASAISIIGGLKRLSDLCAWTTDTREQQQHLEWMLTLAMQQLKQWNHPIVAATIFKHIPQEPLISSRARLNFSTLCQPCDEAEAKIAAITTSPLLGAGAGSSKNPRKRIKAKNKRVGSGKDILFSASGDGIGNSINRAANLRSRSDVPVATSSMSTVPGNLPQRCNISNMICCVCQVSVSQQSLVAVCLWCGHGGHDHHIQEWFDNLDECPMGCGCSCRSLLALPAEANNTIGEDDNAAPQDVSTHSGRFFQTMFATSADAWNMG